MEWGRAVSYEASALVNMATTVLPTFLLVLPPDGGKTFRKSQDNCFPGAHARARERAHLTWSFSSVSYLPVRQGSVSDRVRRARTGTHSSVSRDRPFAGSPPGLSPVAVGCKECSGRLRGGRGVGSAGSALWAVRLSERGQDAIAPHGRGRCLSQLQRARQEAGQGMPSEKCSWTRRCGVEEAVGVHCGEQRRR